MSKDVIDKILSPTEISRQCPYLKFKEYEYLREEPREIYLSSAYYKSSWMWDEIRLAVSKFYNKGIEEAIFFSTDYSVTLKHGIKTKKALQRARQQSDEYSWMMEYENIMIGGSGDQYYSYELCSACQNLKQAWYPMTPEEFLDRGKRIGEDSLSYLPRLKDEVRIISMDIAVANTTANRKNDYTDIKCMRAIRKGEEYERYEVYSEQWEGKPLDFQALRIQQLVSDFGADMVVFDARTFGIDFIDILRKPMYDPERMVTYTPLRVNNDKVLGDRCTDSTARDILFSYIGTAELNHIMHKNMIYAMESGKFHCLVDQLNCKSAYLGSLKQYVLGNAKTRARLEMPYILSGLTANEMIMLTKVILPSGYLKLVEPSTGTKDKYVARAMGNYYITNELELKLTSNPVQNDYGNMKYENGRFVPKNINYVNPWDNYNCVDEINWTI